MTRQHVMKSIIDETLYSLQNLAEKGCRGFDGSEHSLSVLKSWSRAPRHKRRTSDTGKPSSTGFRSAQTDSPDPSGLIKEQVLPESPADTTTPPSPREKIESIATVSSAPQITDSLDSIMMDIEDCRRCKLSETRTRIVFGTGNPTATLMFVGEAPGFDEDQQGLPFVGKAGQLLTRIIQAINLTRDQVYICNVIKCRPPGNRNPEPDEIQACSPFLNRQIASIQPEFICALGTFAARTLLQTSQPISMLRGQFHDYNGIRLLPTFHPSYLLRNPDKKREVWEDMKLLMNEMSP
jgi:uracil-DNA glycosylase family 4